MRVQRSFLIGVKRGPASAGSVEVVIYAKEQSLGWSVDNLSHRRVVERFFAYERYVAHWKLIARY